MKRADDDESAVRVESRGRSGIIDQDQILERALFLQDLRITHNAAASNLSSAGRICEMRKSFEGRGCCGRSIWQTERAREGKPRQ